ncbi:MAG: L,D-transpeptidase/peptidoglycan binding protein, partial [Bacteroidales bacterium]|nr:L,D-transpeptidase/peptidoglycan binding protein [Bacteroidales bacterium]
YYGKHYFPNTTVGGVSCGNGTAKDVVAANEADAGNYFLTVTDRNGNQFYIPGLNFDYSYVNSGEEESILEDQDNFMWLLEISKEHDYDLDVSFTYDPDKLKELVDALDIFSDDYIEAPEDARLEITDTGYEVIEEVPGTTPIEEEILSEVTAAIDAQQTTLVLSDDCYVAPEILATDPEIADLASTLESYLSSTIHYEIEGADENLTSEKILSFLIISDDGDVSVDEDKVADFVQHLASTYNTYGDVRDFVTTKGDTVRIGGGDYGWVISKSEEAAQILSDLEGGVAVSREPVYEQRAVQAGPDDIGDTYVEIDYTNQHLWYYKEGELVTDTDIVSGNINRHNGSPDGVFKIAYLERNATLVGEDYESAVDFFMPFAYNVGIHDASWRSSFGGEIYKSNGSHGCINVPREAAETIFNTIEVGTPVVAYYREEVELTAENARISNAYSYVSKD